MCRITSVNQEAKLILDRKEIKMHIRMNTNKRNNNEEI